MSWLLNLYKTYEANEAYVGEIEKKHNGKEFMLLPVSHTTQQAQIEVQVNIDGTFHSASVIDKEDANTVIPCTEDAASRTSGVEPYPLHDKLSYVAGDYVSYGGTVKKEIPFDAYIRNLGEWANSVHAIDAVKSIYQYLQKGTLIADLVNANILYIDVYGKLLKNWDKKQEAEYGEKPPLFQVLNGEQDSAFVRFNVYSPTNVLKKVWNDPDMYRSFISFYQEKLGDSDICYVTGKELPRTEKHTNKIRNAGDKAKLISANDTSGFTFRGRFHKSGEAASISYEASQKAHNALKWLIHKQGKVIDQRVFLVWNNEQPEVCSIFDDGMELFDDSDSPDEQTAFTGEELAREVSKAIDGYRSRFQENDNVNILVLDAPTTGRLAVLYYRYIEGVTYFNRLQEWHETCKWLHRYYKNDKGERVLFMGAPATKDIAFAAYGPRAGDKLVKVVVERLLPCILDGQKIPDDLVKSAFHRASNPVGMESWEWEKTLSITCALINRKERYSLALDVENQDRSYLFGRLLAVADVLERRALGKGEDRATNAIRYMNAFSKHPARAWKTIQESLQPYQAKLGASGLYLSKLIDEIASQITFDDYNNKPLTGKYLLGFYSQRHALYQKKEEQGSELNEHIES